MSALFYFSYLLTLYRAYVERVAAVAGTSHTLAREAIQRALAGEETLPSLQLGKAIAIAKEIGQAIDEARLASIVLAYTNIRGEHRRIHIVDGDVAKTDEELTTCQQEMQERARAREAVPSPPEGYEVMLVSKADKAGRVVRWSSSMARNLKWWLDEESFKSGPLNVTDVYDLFLAACFDWQRICGVRLSPVSSKAEAVFVVKYTNTQDQPQCKDLLALSFFPDSPKSERIVQLFSAFAKASSPVGILRHEIGHLLGFRHEHILLGKKLPPQYRESLHDAMPLSSYDTQSVMHYDFLGGMSSYEISKLDAQCAQVVYGGPLTLFAAEVDA